MIFFIPLFNIRTIFCWSWFVLLFLLLTLLFLFTLLLAFQYSFFLQTFHHIAKNEYQSNDNNIMHDTCSLMQIFQISDITYIANLHEHPFTPLFLQLVLTFLHFLFISCLANDLAFLLPEKSVMKTKARKDFFKVHLSSEKGENSYISVYLFSSNQSRHYYKTI